MLKTQFSLSFAQIGWIALVYQLTASLLQPWIGMYTDKHPKPYLLPSGMVVTFIGIAMLAFAGSYEMLLVASAVVGIGSATFHPEASRVARMASGGRFGTAQSTFQVGGNTGSAIGPLLAAAIVIPYGQHAIAWFMLAAALAIFVLSRLTAWTIRHGQAKLKSLARNQVVGLNRAQVIQAIVVIAILMFAKFVYIAAFTNYFTFYLIERFSMSVQESQIYLFIFLAAVAAGTFAGGPVGDRIGRSHLDFVPGCRAVRTGAALCRPYADCGIGHHDRPGHVVCVRGTGRICARGGAGTRGDGVWRDVRLDVRHRRHRRRRAG